MRTAFVLALTAAALGGCGTSTQENYARDPMSEIGNYPQPPNPYYRSRAAVVKFQDKTNDSARRQKPVGDQASEQFETLVIMSNRFMMIERQQLDNLLREQNLAGVVDANEIARPGRVRGIDHLFAGAITNFRVKIVKSKMGGGIFDSLIKPIAPLDIDTSKTEVETQVGVDIKLVNTTSGEIVAKHFGEVTRTDVASAWGVRVLGIGGSAKNELQIDADSQGKILRWALDECFKKMLPQIDARFNTQPPVAPPSTSNPGGTPPPPPPPPPGGSSASLVPAGSSDYFLEGYYLYKDGQHYDVGIMKTQPSGEKKEAEFVSAIKGDAQHTSDYAVTRLMTADDIKIGTPVWVSNVDFDSKSFKTLGQASKWWKNNFAHWYKSTVTGLDGQAQGIFQAPIGGSKDVHFSNCRVAK